MNIVIPLAGFGTRFQKVGIKTPKPLIVVNGKTLIEHAITTLKIEGKYIFITRKYDDEEYNKTLSSILKTVAPESIEIMIDKEQFGAADACLYAKDYINNDEELIITNCDQSLSWDPSEFKELISKDIDGAIVLWKSEDPKHSFAEIINNKVVRLAEKDPISNDALMGIHYWKKGKDFVSSAEKLLKEYKSLGFKECYISNTYNYLIEDGKTIAPLHIEPNGYIPLGTPEDVDIYLSKLKEYYSDKPKTIFCDIDGTIIRHVHGFSHVGRSPSEALEGAIDKFNEWDSKGYKIVLTTARKESARYITEKQLTELGFCWDILIMGITSGQRVLINDKLQDKDSDRAISVNAITDQGFDNIEWDKYGL